MATYEQIQKANESIVTTDIKGKNYAEVNQRIKAFRMVYPEGAIMTEMVSNEDGVCVFRATVYTDGDRPLGTGTAYEKEFSTYINKTSYIENCETSAVGRALGMAGFGIDTSVASAEEVQNAQLQQTEMLTIGITKAKALALKCQNDGVNLEKLMKLYKVGKLEDLTEKQHSNAINHWEKVKETCSNE